MMSLDNEIYRALAEQTADHILVTDPDGLILYVNPAFTALTGYEVDEVLGQNPRILKSGMHDKTYYKNQWDTILSGQVYRGLSINKKKDGTLYYEEKTITPVKDAEGTITHLISTGKDVTERVEAEQALVKSEAYSRHILDNVLDAVISMDEDGRIIGWNSEAEKMFGWPAKKIIGQKMTEAIVPQQHPHTHDNELKLSNKIGEGSTLNKRLEMIGRHADGYEFPIELTVIPGQEQGKSIFHAFARDISERIKNETTLRTYREELNEKANTLQAILNAVPGAIFWKDRNGVYLGCNEYFARFAGTTPKEIVGKTDSDMAWAKELADAFRADDSEVMATGVEKLGIIESLRQADGSQTWLETNKIALKDAKGVVYGVLGTFVDVTDRIRLQEQANASLDQRSRQVSVSTSIAQEIASAPDLNDLYQRVVKEIKEQLGYYHVQLLRNAPVLDTLVLIAGYGEAGQKMKAMNHTLPMGVGLIGKAAATGKAVFRPNVTDDPNWRSNPLLPHTKGELAVPIKSGDQVLGVLDVQSDKLGALTEDDQLLLEGLCGQIAIAIESTTLREEMEGRLRELNLLQQQMSLTGWKEHQNRRRERLGYLYDMTGVQTLGKATKPARENGRFLQQNGVSTQDTPSPELSQLSQPLVVRGKVIGNFGIEEDPERPLTEEERQMIESVSLELAEALEAARLFEQTQLALTEQERLASELETVAKVSTAASTILEADELLQSVVDLAKSSFNLYHAHIYLTHEGNKKLILKAGAGNIGRLMALEGQEISIDAESLVARAARTRKGVLENNVRRTIDFLPHPLLPETQSEMALPMLVGGKLVGVLDLQSNYENFFTEDDLNVQTTLAAQIAVAVENANQYAAQVQTAVKLREVDQLKSEFLASMSHELRTPLNSIIGFADVLLEGLDGDLNERMEEDVRLIRESGNHLRGLIGDILDMSKIEAGRMDLRYEEIDIVQFTNDLVATSASLAQEKNLYLHLDIHESVTTVKADRTRLRQIMWNIVGNAIKFTEKGGVTIAIQPKSNYLLCSIRDTGIGIKEEHADVVFEQFRQIDGGLNRAAGGTGLGMPITKKLVELHGGDIWIESVYGQGSTFFFTLPYHPPAAQPKAIEAVANSN